MLSDLFTAYPSPPASKIYRQLAVRGNEVFFVALAGEVDLDPYLYKETNEHTIIWRSLFFRCPSLDLGAVVLRIQTLHIHILLLC